MNNPNDNLNNIRPPSTTEPKPEPKPEPVKSNGFFGFFSKLKDSFFKPKTTTENGLPQTNEPPKLGGKRKNRRTKKNKKSKSVKSRK